jgi:hypothetical protein
MVYSLACFNLFGSETGAISFKEKRTDVVYVGLLRG